jgi:vacuolar-type H+-ATPase subunit I/STV1
MSRPDCWDLMTHEKLDVHDSFVAQLTHSAYFIQTLRIKPSINTRLEKLLSLFEQRNFIGGDETTKRYPFPTDDEEISEIKEALGILQYVAADEKMREELDLENYYLKSVEWSFGEQIEKMDKQKQELDEKNKTIAQHVSTIAQLQKDKIETALKLLLKGMAIEDVTDATGLPQEEIKRLTNL